MDPLTGTVARLVRSRGFGFILSDPPLDAEPGNGKREEYFFHVSGLTDPSLFASLQEGDRVNFTLTDSPKGRRAEEIRVVRRTA